jgi:hypothetical protein
MHSVCESTDTEFRYECSVFQTSRREADFLHSSWDYE